MKVILATKEERDLVVKEYGAAEGGIQIINKLEEYLSKNVN